MISHKRRGYTVSAQAKRYGELCVDNTEDQDQYVVEDTERDTNIQDARKGPADVQMKQIR